MKKMYPFYNLIILILMFSLSAGCTKTALEVDGNKSGDTGQIPVQTAVTTGEFSIFIVKDGADLEKKLPDLDSIQLDDAPVLTIEDIDVYRWNTHQFKLKDPDMLEKRLEGSVPVSGKKFVLVAGDQRIYLGAFWTYLSSLMPPELPYIMSIWHTGSNPEWYRFRYEGEGKDIMNDTRIYEALKKQGILDEAQYTDINAGTSEKGIMPATGDTKQYAAEEDLNGDGKLDAIRVTILDEYSDEYKLQVNDCLIYGTGIDVEPEFTIVNIDKNDKMKEIAVSEYGPSDDLKTAFYLYDGKKIIAMGKTQGFCSGTKSNYNNIECDGSGRFTTYSRGNILQTWFYKDIYTLDENHCVKHVPQDLYEMNTAVKVIEEISLQKSPEDKATAFKLVKGEQVTILASDDKEWCLVENSKKQKGWFAVEGYDNIKGTGMYASEVFEGLCYAD